MLWWLALWRSVWAGYLGICPQSSCQIFWPCRCCFLWQRNALKIRWKSLSKWGLRPLKCMSWPFGQRCCPILSGRCCLPFPFTGCSWGSSSTCWCILLSLCAICPIISTWSTLASQCGKWWKSLADEWRAISPALFCSILRCSSGCCLYSWWSCLWWGIAGSFWNVPLWWFICLTICPPWQNLAPGCSAVWMPRWRLT